MVYRFRTSEPSCEVKPTAFSEEIEWITRALNGLEFTVETSAVNSGQLNSGFDNALRLELCNLPGWKAEPTSNWPRLDALFGWNAKPDVVMRSHRKATLIIEVEKGNKYKVYDDLMKLRLFANSGSHSCGVLICPMNHPNRKSNRNPFGYAKRAIHLLQCAAKVDASFLERTALIGYRQLVFDGSRFVELTPDLRSTFAHGNR